jgi:hypothetical protein
MTYSRESGTKRQYTSAITEVIELQQEQYFLSNPGDGEGNIPPTPNDDNDDNW